MRFGLLYEHQLPRPWTEGTEHRLFKDALAQVELADRLGIDYIWEVEHHFLEEYAHSSAPEVFLAACAARTSRIRIGHGVVLAPPGYNHPARVAERIATLDLVVRRPRRLGHRRIGLARRARGLRHRSGREEGDVGRGGRADRRHDGDEPLSRLQGQVLLHAGAQRGAQAVAEAASADLGGVQPARDHPCRGARGHRRAHLRLRRSGRGRQVGARILRDHQERPVRADRPHGQRQRRHGDRLLLPRGSRRGAPARRRGLPVLRLFARPLLRLRPSPAGRHRRLAALRGGQGQAAAGRAGQRHRHAGRAHRASARLPGRRRRPGRVHPAGRPQQARAHLRFARACSPPRSCRP